MLNATLKPRQQPRLHHSQHLVWRSVPLPVRLQSYRELFTLICFFDTTFVQLFAETELEMGNGFRTEKSVISPNELISWHAAVVTEMQKLARVGPGVDFNGQAKELRCRFEQQEQAPVPDHIFKDFTHRSMQNE